MVAVANSATERAIQARNEIASLKARLVETEQERDDLRKKLQDATDVLFTRDSNPALVCIEEVAKHFCVPFELIRTLRSRAGSNPLIRQAAYYVLHVVVGSSYPQIARLFDGRDHTTILYGVRKIKNLIENGDGIADDIAAIMEVVRQRLEKRRNALSAARGIRVRQSHADAGQGLWPPPEPGGTRPDHCGDETRGHVA